MTSRRLLPVLIMLLCCTGIFAQKEEDVAKEKQRRQMVLIESITSDTREFRLAENRAVVFAKIGSSLWDRNQKRARDWFQDAVNELIGAQTAAEAARKPGQQNELLTGQSTRPQILQAIAARDAEFALRSLYKTRPAAIERAIANSKTKDSKVRSNSGNDVHYAQSEIQLEQTLIRMAADQNPEKAIALLKTALKNGVSGETLNLLKKLFEKDPAAANELASDVADKLGRKSFMVSNQPDYQSIQLATSILSEHVRERPLSEKALRFDSSQMGSLAEKLISFYIERGSQYGYGLGPQIVQIAEKLAPSSVEKLKQVEKNMPRYGRHHYNQDPELAKILNHETPVAQMLAEAAKLPVESRTQIYQSAATKLAGAGDFAGARNILSEYFSGDALENAESSLNWTYSQHLISAGRFAEAESLIDEFPDANRLSALISLASSVFGRDETKNKSYAVALLEKARGQLSAKPETSNEMSQIMQIISAYSKIEPSEAFRILDGLVQPVNEIAEAAVIVNGFQGGYSVRQGEMLISQGNSLGIYFDTSIFRNLAQIDFDRTLSVIGGISRREMRVSLKQQLLEGL
ncbi:MAG: hypothetical protein ABIU09_11965 [Pyrinomonadaceae bacterium]